MGGNTGEGSLQRQARALGDPTRHEIFRLVREASDGLPVATLAAAMDLHPNAVRQHLAKLADAGLVIGTPGAPHGRGRPPVAWTLAPGVEARLGEVGPYEFLAELLAEVIRTGDTPFEVGRREGRRLGALRPGPGGPTDALVDELARLGFDPDLRPRAQGIDIALRACPFERLAVADPATVCDLHLGLAHGTAEAVGGLEVDRLVVRDPRRANCHLLAHAHPDTPDGVYG